MQQHRLWAWIICHLTVFLHRLSLVDLRQLRLKQTGGWVTVTLVKFGTAMTMNCETSMGLHLLSCVGATKHAFSNNVKMPWERKFLGPYERFVEVQKMPMPVRDLISAVNVVATDTAAVQPTEVGSAFRKAGLKMLKACDEKLWVDRLSAERKAAIRKWTTLVSEEPLAWEVAVQHFCQGAMVYASGGLSDSIKDTLAAKASNTLHARANPLFRFVKFCNDHGIKAWPIREAAVYDFLNSDTNFAPTFPRSLIISIVFAHHLLGLKGDVDRIATGRTKGLSHSWFLKKKRLVQKPPLSVDQVALLERIVVDENRGNQDRMAAGFFAFTTYCRARYSDALSVSGLRLDITLREGRAHGWLEADASRTKTSTSLEKRTRFLPMSAPVRSVSGLDWTRAWLQLRREANLEAEEGRPLLPAPNDGGGWANVPLSATSAAIWLKSLLQGSTGPDVALLGTHSMKCTLLSWTAKFGLDAAVRRALGYHTSQADRSVNIYARDSMAAPLRELQRVIDAIREKEFMPDETRSGFFRNGDARNVGAGNVEEHIESSSESSCDEEDNDQAADEVAIDKVAGSWQGNKETPWTSITAAYFRHCTSRCIHVLMDEGGSDFCCGRRITTAYVRLGKRPDFLHPMCSTCERVINR